MADAMSLIASAIGSALQAKGAKEANKALVEGQKEAADYALTESLPWNVAGSLGGVKFDADGKAVGLGLSDTFQKQQDAMIASADANRGYLSGIEADPITAENRYYEQQMALLRPEQEAEREALDAQLVARGMLGSTGGMGQSQALREAQGTTNLQVRQSASDRVQDMIDRYRTRVSEDVSGAAQLGQLPLDYANLGVGIGGMLSDAAIAGSKYISGANMANARYRGARYAGPGQAIKNFKGFDKGYSWGSRSNNTQYGGAGPKTAAQASYLSKNVYSNL
jgi:hypothetical protein|tara:strand:+ start:718 stop:1557 length:840 start_codon:yes stop_codon:yes gene_type:complete